MRYVIIALAVNDFTLCGVPPANSGIATWTVIWALYKGTSKWSRQHLELYFPLGFSAHLQYLKTMHITLHFIVFSVKNPHYILPHVAAAIAFKSLKIFHRRQHEYFSCPGNEYDMWNMNMSYFSGWGDHHCIKVQRKSTDKSKSPIILTAYISKHICSVGIAWHFAN